MLESTLQTSQKQLPLLTAPTMAQVAQIDLGRVSNTDNYDQLVSVRDREEKEIKDCDDIPPEDAPYSFAYPGHKCVLDCITVKDFNRRNSNEEYPQSVELFRSKIDRCGQLNMVLLGFESHWSVKCPNVYRKWKSSVARPQYAIMCHGIHDNPPSECNNYRDCHSEHMPLALNAICLLGTDIEHEGDIAGIEGANRCFHSDPSMENAFVLRCRATNGHAQKKYWQFCKGHGRRGSVVANEELESLVFVQKFLFVTPYYFSTTLKYILFDLITCVCVEY